MTVDAASLREAIERELRGNLLPFWRERALDPVSGRFVAARTHRGEIVPGAPLGLVLAARLLWTYAALSRALDEPRDRELAELAYRTLVASFHDERHGGFFWRVDSAGRPLDRAKKSYGQAFALYALAEYVAATDAKEALALTRETFDALERGAHDPEHGGYFEARSETWGPTADQRLGDDDPNVAKSMNNHLHLVEAFAALLEVDASPGARERTAEILDLFLDRIAGFDPHSGAMVLRHFFDADWRLRSSSHTFGHDIEAAWLLPHCAERLGDETRRHRVATLGLDLARSVLARGIDRSGAIRSEERGTTLVASHRDWWCQAEGVVGFWHAHAVSGESAFAEAAATVWRFVERRVVDRERGEWHWRIDADDRPDPSQPKVSEWKGPYHNCRMCLEMLRRIGATQSENRG